MPKKNSTAARKAAELARRQRALSGQRTRLERKHRQEIGKTKRTTRRETLKGVERDMGTGQRVGRSVDRGIASAQGAINRGVDRVHDAATRAQKKMGRAASRGIGAVQRGSKAAYNAVADATPRKVVRGALKYEGKAMEGIGKYLNQGAYNLGKKGHRNLARGVVYGGGSAATYAANKIADKMTEVPEEGYANGGYIRKKSNSGNQPPSHGLWGGREGNSYLNQKRNCR